MKIEINYIATDGYVEFFDKFRDTIGNFFPGVKKIVRILSNVSRDFGITNNDVERVDVIKIFDLIYPCINLNKTYFLSQLPPTDADYVFYFDADTYFNKVSGFVFDELLDHMDEGNFCMSYHPKYNLDDSVDYKKEDIEIFFSCMTERDSSQLSYIDSYYYTYIISSFFCARRDVFFDVCNEVTEMIRGDMRRDNKYRIPMYMDENYFNKLVYNYEVKNDRTFNFKIDSYILLGNSYNKENIYNGFITQKNYNNDLKRYRR